MTDVVVDRLRIRGTGARRLAAVAARVLPAALDDALTDLADGTIGKLDVHLDLDPADYDDVTLATLWADRIRSAALAAGATVRPTHPHGGRPTAEPAAGARAAPAVPATTPDADRVGSADPVDTVGTLVAAVRDWLAADAPASGVPHGVAALTEPTFARTVVDRLGPDLSRQLADAIDRIGGPAVARTPAPGATDGEPRMPRPGRATSAAAHPTTASTTGPPADPADRTTDRVVAATRTASEHVALARTADPAATVADLTAPSTVAGLVLCYPWLAELCREAEQVHPLTEPSHARRVVLAVLVGGDEADAGLLDDPLVRFLAGAPDDAPPSSALAPVDTGPLAAPATHVLARLAGLLPGFERSTPGFVRTSWLVRPGLLDTDRRPAHLLAATMPLDVMLHRLPFPVTAFRLPWTPPLTVRFVP